MMDESKFKELIKQSEVSTSMEFMDKLMSNIPDEEQKTLNIDFPLLKPLLIAGGLLLLCGFIWLNIDKLIHLYLATEISLKYPMMVLSSGLIIWLMDRYLRMKTTIPI